MRNVTYHIFHPYILRLFCKNLSFISLIIFIKIWIPGNINKYQYIPRPISLNLKTWSRSFPRLQRNSLAFPISPRNMSLLLTFPISRKSGISNHFPPFHQKNGISARLSQFHYETCITGSSVSAEPFAKNVATNVHQSTLALRLLF